MQPYHEADDQTKIAELIAAITRDGWQGAPLVTWGEDQLLTGAHRFAAVDRLVRDDVGFRVDGRLCMSRDDIPTIDIADVYDEAGLSWDAVVANHDLDASTGGYGIDHPALGAILNDTLPAAIRNKYGIDLA